MTFEELTVGQKASLTKTFLDKDVREFADVSMDTNPIHLDEEAAKKSIFGRRVVHGIATAGLISAVIGDKLPGFGSIYLGQNLKFTAPVFLGDTITATCEVTALRADKHIVTLSTVCTNQDGKVVITGEAVVKCK